MTRGEARRQAQAIARDTVARTALSWADDQRSAGRPVEDIEAEIHASARQVDAAIAKAAGEIAPLLIEIAAGKAMLAAIAAVDDPEAELLDDLRRRGVRLHPLHGWWPS